MTGTDYPFYGDTCPCLDSRLPGLHHTDIDYGAQNSLALSVLEKDADRLVIAGQSKRCLVRIAPPFSSFSWSRQLASFGNPSVRKKAWPEIDINIQQAWPLINMTWDNTGKMDGLSLSRP